MTKRKKRRQAPPDVPRVQVTLRVPAGDEFLIEITSNSMDASTVAQIAQSTVQGIITQNAIVPSTDTPTPDPSRASEKHWLHTGALAVIKWTGGVLTALLIAYIVYLLKWN